MSVNYASRLSEYSDKGVCGVPEVIAVFIIVATIDNISYDYTS